MVTVKDIFELIDGIAPFLVQESYDNSGLVVGSCGSEVKRILLALDITKSVAKEAVEKDCDLVISHHPVIFNGLKKLDPENPAVMLAANGISALCMHTNFDIAKGGMNDILCERLGLVPSESLAEENGISIGYVCDCDEIMSCELAKKVKSVLGNTVVRYVDSPKAIRRIAVCSGSGGSLLGCAMAKKADAFITGDIKHDVFIDAFNNDICLVDAGHYYTENIFFDLISEKLRQAFGGLEVSVAESNRDVTVYEI